MIIFRNIYGLVIGALLILGSLIYLHTSLSGKIKIWDKLIAQQKLKGNELILDLGCGHGSVLII